MCEVKGKIIISKEELNSRVKSLAGEISADYEGLNPVIITVLRGAVYFLLTFPVNCQYLTQLISRYFQLRTLSRTGW